MRNLILNLIKNVPSSGHYGLDEPYIREVLRAVDGCQLKYKSCRDDRNTLGRSKDSPVLLVPPRK